MEILREARPPYRYRNPRRWAYYLSALFLGLGLGSILWFGLIFIGALLAVGSVWLFHWAGEHR